MAPAAAHERLLAATVRRPMQDPVAAYLDRLSPGSRATQTAAVRSVIAALETSGAPAAAGGEVSWGRLRPRDAVRLRETLAARYAPATANRLLAALRGVLREGWRLGVVDAEVLQRVSELPPVHGQVAAVPAAPVDTATVDHLLRACAGGDPAAARDAVVIVLLAAGLRRGELLGLRCDDVESSAGGVDVLVRDARGRRSRVVTLSGRDERPVRTWLARAGDTEQPLVRPVDRRGRVLPRAITTQALGNLLRRRALAAGVSPESVTPSALRRLAGSAPG